MGGDELFKDWFKQRRKSLDFTQEDLARQVGCSVATIRGVEQGGLRPSRQLAQLIAAALEVPSGEQAAFTLWARGAVALREPRAAGVPTGANGADAGVVAPPVPQPAGNGGAPHATGEPPNPYKGLRAFQEADAPDFFGREALTARLRARLGEESDLSRFLAVVGSSGAGKSSLVRAGLIPAAAPRRAPRRRDPAGRELIPGAHPFEELEAGLLRVAVNPPRQLDGATARRRARAGPRGQARAARGRKERAGAGDRPVRGAVYPGGATRRRAPTSLTASSPRSATRAAGCGWWSRCGPTSTTARCSISPRAELLAGAPSWSARSPQTRCTGRSPPRRSARGWNWSAAWPPRSCRTWPSSPAPCPCCSTP